MVQAWVGHFVTPLKRRYDFKVILSLVYISLVLVYIRRVTTTRRDGTKSTNNRQTPPPWWSRLPLQRHGFDEPMPPEGWAALCMFVPVAIEAIKQIP
jgi:hypothetical protein